MAKCAWLVSLLFVVIAAVVVAVVVTQVLGNDDTDSTDNTDAAVPGQLTTAPPSSSIAQESPPSSTTVAPSFAPTRTGFQACNGLESLCDFRVNQVLFATLHNAVSSEQDGVVIVPNHKLKLEEALRAGFRGLNFDMGICDGEIRLVHGVCQLGTRDPIEVFTNIYNFLLQKPNDVILMPVQLDTENGNVALDDINNLMQQVEGFTDMLYSHTPNNPWPTLRELIADGTRILFFHYNGDSCADLTCPPGFHDWFAYAVETNFEMTSVDAVSDTATSCAITRGQEGTRDFFGMNLFTTLPLNCDSLNAAAYAANHLAACRELNGGQPPSALIIDCWTKGEILQVVRKSNEAL